MVCGEGFAKIIVAAGRLHKENTHSMGVSVLRIALKSRKILRFGEPASILLLTICYRTFKVLGYSGK
jgi:hypothetical protein